MPKKIAVVGATGAVGSELLDALFESGFTAEELVVFAGTEGAGAEVDFGGDSLSVLELTEEALHALGGAVVVLAAPADICKRYAPAAVKAGALVIDCSGMSIGHEQSRLFLPEVNAPELRDCLRSRAEGEGIRIRLPGGVSSPLASVLNPLHQRAGIERLVVSTYQSVSGSGRRGMDELWEQTRALYNQSKLVTAVFGSQIAFNCIPQVESFDASGSTAAEQRIIQEVRELLSEPELPMSVTAVQVPVFSCHAMSVNVSFNNPLAAEEAREILRESPGVVVVDEPESAVYPQGVDVCGSAATHVGRIRKDSSAAHGLALWLVADNLRKSAALTIVQLIELAKENR